MMSKFHAGSLVTSAAFAALSVAFSTATVQAAEGLEEGPNSCQDTLRADPRFRSEPGGTIWTYTPKPVSNNDVTTPLLRRLYGVGVGIVEERPNGKLYESLGVVFNQRDCHEFRITRSDYERLHEAGKFNFSLKMNYDDSTSKTRTCLPVPATEYSAADDPKDKNVVIIRFKLGENEGNRKDRQRVLNESDGKPVNEQVWCYSADMPGIKIHYPLWKPN